MSRPRERRETGEQDLFRARLDQIINMSHELVRLARAIDWPVLEERFGAVYADGPGMPPLPTRPPLGGAALACRSVDGGVGDPQAHVRPVGRSAVRPLGGEPVRREIAGPSTISFPPHSSIFATRRSSGTNCHSTAPR